MRRRKVWVCLALALALVTAFVSAPRIARYVLSSHQSWEMISYERPSFTYWEPDMSQLPHFPRSIDPDRAIREKDMEAMGFFSKRISHLLNTMPERQLAIQVGLMNQRGELIIQFIEHRRAGATFSAKKVGDRVQLYLSLNPWALARMSEPDHVRDFGRMVIHEIGVHHNQQYARYVREGDEESLERLLGSSLHQVYDERRCLEMWDREYPAYKYACEESLRLGLMLSEVDVGGEDYCLAVQDDKAFRQRVMGLLLYGQGQFETLKACPAVWAVEAGHPHPWAYDRDFWLTALLYWLAE